MVQAAKPEVTESPNLARKIANVRGQIHRLAKDGQVQGKGGYKYTSVDDMSDAVRDLEAEQGIVTLPESIEQLYHMVDEREIERDGQKLTRIQWVTSIKVHWLVTDGITEYRIESLGMALANSDKTPNVAMTYARKNMMIALYGLSTGDDPDAKPGSMAESSGRRREVESKLAGAVTKGGDSFEVRAVGSGKAYDDLRAEVAKIDTAMVKGGSGVSAQALQVFVDLAKRDDMLAMATRHGLEKRADENKLFLAASGPEPDLKPDTTPSEPPVYIVKVRDPEDPESDILVVTTLIEGETQMAEVIGKLEALGANWDTPTAGMAVPRPEWSEVLSIAEEYGLSVDPGEVSK
jgi:hypothetical protein